MADVTVNYKGTAIATMDSSGTKTLETAGKYCEGDIVVEYVDPEKPTQEKSVTPAETAQEVTPDSGKVLSKVSVGAIPGAYVGSEVTRKAAQTYTPGTADQIIAEGQYLSGAQTVKGDAKLKSENIREGISIFGVPGAHKGGKEEEAITVPLDMANGDQIVTPSEGKTLSQVTITQPDDLSPSRVVLGSNIGGVDGNYFAPEIWVLNEEIKVPAKAETFTDLAFLTYATRKRDTNDPFPIQTMLQVAPTGKVVIASRDAAGNITYIKRPAAMSSGDYTDTNGWYGEPELPQIGRVMVFLQPTSSRNVQSWLKQNAVLYGGDTFNKRKKGLFELGDIDFVKVLDVTANGTYNIKPNAPYSMFGGAEVNVNIPVPAIQDTKALTITSNGTVSVTPDAPYDALKKVDVQINIDPYNTEMAETVTCLGATCPIYGVYFMSGNDGNKVIAPYAYPPSQTNGAKILKGSHITFQSTSGGFPIYWAPSDALSVVSDAIYYPSGSKYSDFYVCKVVKDFRLSLDD